MQEAVVRAGDCCSCKRLLFVQEAVVRAGGCYTISLRMVRLSTISSGVAMVTMRCNNYNACGNSRSYLRSSYSGISRQPSGRSKSRLAQTMMI